MTREDLPPWSVWSTGIPPPSIVSFATTGVEKSNIVRTSSSTITGYKVISNLKHNKHFEADSIVFFKKQCLFTNLLTINHNANFEISTTDLI